MPKRDAGDAAEEELLEQIRRFPELFPASIGGTRRDLHVPTQVEVDAILFSEGGDVAKKVLADRREREAQHKDDADRAVGDEPIAPIDPIDLVED